MRMKVVVLMWTKLILWRKLRYELIYRLELTVVRMRRDERLTTELLLLLLLLLWLLRLFCRCSSRVVRWRRGG